MATFADSLSTDYGVSKGKDRLNTMRTNILEPDATKYMNRGTKLQPISKLHGGYTPTENVQKVKLYLSYDIYQLATFLLEAYRKKSNKSGTKLDELDFNLGDENDSHVM